MSTDLSPCSCTKDRTEKIVSICIIPITILPSGLSLSRHIFTISVVSLPVPPTKITSVSGNSEIASMAFLLITETFDIANLAKFEIQNVSVIGKNASEAISELPDADAIFVGGTGKDTAEIVGMCLDKLKPEGRIVIGMIQIETIFSVLSFVEKQGLKSIDITQITISKSRKTSTGTMMLARNPVTVLSATKN